MPCRKALFIAPLMALCATAASAQQNENAQENSVQTIRVSAADKAACMPDALRYCRDALPNVQDVLVCFGRNREKISTGCRTVLAGYGLQ